MKEAAAGMGMNKWVTDVPVIVAVEMQKMKLTARIGSVIKDKEYSLLDVGIAVEHFCLQASELGLGSCLIGWFDEKEVKKLLDIPKLDVANNAGTKHSGDATLIVTEGESAKALAVGGLGVVGRDNFGVFPLRVEEARASEA